jgi:hypothetical protein
MPLQPEQVDHINIVNWFNYQYPELADDFHHFANERKCSIQQGRLFKRMGVKKGVADFFLAYPIHGKAGLWLELKVGKNKPSKEQIEFGERKIQRGYQFAFVWGFDAAKEMLSTYLKDYIPNSDKIMTISFT